MPANVRISSEIYLSFFDTKIIGIIFDSKIIMLSILAYLLDKAISLWVLSKGTITEWVSVQRE